MVSVVEKTGYKEGREKKKKTWNTLARLQSDHTKTVFRPFPSLTTNTSLPDLILTFHHFPPATLLTLPFLNFLHVFLTTTHPHPVPPKTKKIIRLSLLFSDFVPLASPQLPLLSLLISDIPSTAHTTSPSSLSQSCNFNPLPPHLDHLAVQYSPLVPLPLLRSFLPLSPLTQFFPLPIISSISHASPI